ncbi:uncharacterized protein isoform X2 [Rhodnius prolixus]|uniref:uncharacterized protein isoform X2 n=1 Tax=Rhodnius prolixus TaxID=13249 RepID=UPI003D18A9D2
MAMNKSKFTLLNYTTLTLRIKLTFPQRLNTDDSAKKMEIFLDIIVKKSPSEVEHFLKYLEVWYDWLYDLIVNPNKNIPLQDDLIRGGVPPLPHRNITRKSLVDHVRQILIDLNRDQCLVLHGMMGCGKTSLATEAIYCNEVHELCKGRIYWFPVGSEGEKNLPSLQECLNAILPEPEPNLTDDVKVALCRLRTRFSEWKEGRDALIVLDDVHSEKVVTCLSVGTKLLITTENENIIPVNRKSVTYFEKVPDGFEEEETLALFASGVGLKPQELPPQARVLHKVCKGHPMTISLINGQLEDHKEQMLAKNTSRWDYYVKLFSDKKLKRKSLDYWVGIDNAIKNSIESISEKGKEYFKHFVLFVEDVNLKPKVLSIIWSMDKHEVENLMMEYVRKSLIVRKWNAKINSYVFGIHHLILQHLLRGLDKDYVESLHRNLIECYMKECNGDLSKLKEEDNYIFFYIGRHLKCAKMYKMFPILYLDMEFIEMKLKKAGPADVILNFKQYRNLIIGNNEIDYINKYNSFLQFVEIYGSWVHRGLDIVQLALQEDSNSYVYKCAIELAKRRNISVPYVLFPLGPNYRKRIVPQMVTIKKDISCVCCIDSSYFVLIGMYNGSIELWDLKSKVMKRNFNEHNGYISTLKINPTSDKFLSTSTDSTVRIWDLVQDVGSDRSPSPRERQDSYSEFWPSSVENSGEKSCKILSHSGPVLWASFAQSSTSNLMATVSHPSELTIWDGSFIKWNQVEDNAKSCVLYNADLWVVVGGSEKVSIYEVESANLLQCLLNWKANFLFVIPENLGGGLLMVSEDRVDVWGTSKEPPTIIPSDIHQQESYTCCALSGHIALGTSMNNVIVCHRHTGKALKRLSASSTNSEVVSVGLTEGALITAYSDKTVFLWPLDDLMLPVSCISWPIDSTDPFISIVTLDNSVQICRGRKVVKNISVDQEIVQLELSSDGKLIAYTCSHSTIIHIERVDTKEIGKCNMEIDLPFKFFLLSHEGKAVIAATKENCPVKVWFQLTDKILLLGKESSGSTFISMPSKDDLTIITASPSFGIHIWDLRTGSVIRKLSLLKPDTLSFSFNRRTIALSEGNVIQVINSTEPVCTESFTQEALVICCSLSPNGKIVVYALSNNRMILYNTELRKRKEYKIDRKINVDMIMAVSNSGVLCVALSEPLVAVFTDLGISYLVLHASSIIASPSHPEKFAVLDNCGELHVLHVCYDNNDLI